MRGKTSERLGHGGAVLLLLNQSTPRAPQIPKLSDQISRVRLVGGVGRRDREGEARGSRQISGLDEAINSRSIQSPEWQRFGGPVSFNWQRASERASKKSKKGRQRKEAALTTAGGAPAASSPAAGAAAVGSCSGWLSIITGEGCRSRDPSPRCQSLLVVWWRRGAVAI